MGKTGYTWWTEDGTKMNTIGGYPRFVSGRYPDPDRPWVVMYRTEDLYNSGYESWELYGVFSCEYNAQSAANALEKELKFRLYDCGGPDIQISVKRAELNKTFPIITTYDV